MCSVHPGVPSKELERNTRRDIKEVGEPESEPKPMDLGSERPAMPPGSAGSGSVPSAQCTTDQNQRHRHAAEATAPTQLRPHLCEDA